MMAYAQIELANSPAPSVMYLFLLEAVTSQCVLSAATHCGRLLYTCKCGTVSCVHSCQTAGNTGWTLWALPLTATTPSALLRADGKDAGT